METDARTWRAMLLGMCLLGVASRIGADQVAVPKRYARYSAGKQFCIEMVPKRGDYRAGAGQGFVRRAGSKEVLWQVDWYSSEVWLGDDGVHLVRLGPWASDWKGLLDLAIGFYAGGRKLKEYVVKDLIKDRDRLQMSVSHYWWRDWMSEGHLKRHPEAWQQRGPVRYVNVKRLPPSEDRLSRDQKTFRLAMIDGGVYIFDVATGDIRLWKPGRSVKN